MSPKVVIATALVSLWSVSQLYSPEVANARPSAGQVEDWMRSGAAAIGFTTEVYAAYNTYIRDGEVKRLFTARNGRVLFSYTANCRDRRDVDRFWQHADNGTVTEMILHVFPNNPRSRRQVVLNLINRACSPS